MCGDLQQCSRRVLFSVHHQAGAVPEGQAVAQEDDQPHVSGEEAHDQTLPDAPALRRDQVPVVPVEERRGASAAFIQGNVNLLTSMWQILPLHFFDLSTESRHGPDGGEDLVGHGAGFGVGLQLHPR